MNKNTKVKVIQYFLAIIVLLCSLAAMITPFYCNFVLKQTVPIIGYVISFMIAIVATISGIMMLPSKGDT